LTEKLDYFSAASVVLVNLYVALFFMLKDFLLKDFLFLGVYISKLLSSGLPLVKDLISRKRDNNKRKSNGVMISSPQERPWILYPYSEWFPRFTGFLSVLIPFSIPFQSWFTTSLPQEERRLRHNKLHGNASLVRPDCDQEKEVKLEDEKEMRVSCSLMLTLAIPFFSFYFYHVYHLSFVFFDYGYNMRVNLVAGKLSVFLG